MRAAIGWPLLTLLVSAGVALAQTSAHTEVTLERLLGAYPEHLERIEGKTLVWKDGTRMALDDGKGEKSFEDWLADPDIEDMFAVPYPAGDLAAPPARNADPGRARNAAFFDRMYGDCRRGEGEPNLVEVQWLPKKANQRLRVTRINGVAERLTAVSRELDELPARFDRYLIPAAGSYNCRPIAGTERLSAHGYGIAVDLALAHAHYWRWARPDGNGAYPYQNAIPVEIVRIFEKHGFIWGGKWYHYDTMHFEYRPELVGPAR
jgi:D-alanyl-D-alanine carboxypeptidase